MTQVLQTPFHDHVFKLIELDIVPAWSEQLLGLISATPNKYLKGSTVATLQVFVELSANDASYMSLFEVPDLIETLVSAFVLKPRRIWSGNILCEISSIYQNLCGVDELSCLNRVIEAGMPMAVLTLLAQYGLKSQQILFNSLEAL